LIFQVFRITVIVLHYCLVVLNWGHTLTLTSFLSGWDSSASGLQPY